MQALSIRNLRKTYPGGLEALKGIALDVEAGDFFVLMGQNGAGKSTLVKILAGAERPTSGTVEIQGRTVHLSSPAEAHRLGIAPVFQEMAVIPAATGWENANLGLPYPRLGPFVHWSELRRRTVRAGKALGLAAADFRREARTMSVAELQMIAICRGLLQDAQLVLLDEPTAALTEPEVERLHHVIRELAAAGVTVLYISHRLDEVVEIANRVTVLRDGRRIATLPGTTPRAEVVALITGGIDEPASVTAPHAPSSMAVLEARAIRPTPGGGEVSLALHGGEIVGLAGLVGSGRTTIAGLLAGLASPTGGQLMLDGRSIRLGSPRAAVRRGIVFVPEDRRRQGLVISQSVSFNISLASLGRLRWLGAFVDRRRERRSTREYITQLSIRCRSGDQPVWQLSGGNQQKTVLARWMLRGARVFIVDEPTVGLDVAARAEVHGVLRTLADGGAAVLFISSDLDELATVVDRAIVLREGRVVAELGRERLSKTEILRHCYEVSEAA
jgi:ABC-type sugar transport system ATPase subunit